MLLIQVKAAEKRTCPSYTATLYQKKCFEVQRSPPRWCQRYIAPIWMGAAGEDMEHGGGYLDWDQTRRIGG